MTACPHQQKLFLCFILTYEWEHLRFDPNIPPQMFHFVDVGQQSSVLKVFLAGMAACAGNFKTKQ